MLFSRVEIAGLYTFNGAVLDLTYERKLANNTISNEYLSGHKNFNIKKVCILSGANASGKTTFGKILCGIQNYLSRNNIVDYLKKGLNNDNVAEIKVEFVVLVDKAWHLRSVTFSFNKDGIISEEYASIKIGKNDSSRTARKKLKARVTAQENGRNKNDYKKYLHDSPIGKSNFSEDLADEESNNWTYVFAETSPEQETTLWNDDQSISPNFIYRVLHTYDPNISKIVAVYEDQKEDAAIPEAIGFNIHFVNGDRVLIDKDGQINDKTRLSLGTYKGIRVTGFLSRVIRQANNKFPSSGIFYLDEQLVNSHSEIEKGIVNLIIDKLGENSQFFHTTHNYDLLDMNLPIHSYMFFRKDEYTEIVAPEKEFKKNDRSLINYVKNDIFGTLPNLDGLDEILMENIEESVT